MYASSVGAYSPGPEDRHRVNEDHPTHGIAPSTYARQKAYVERILDAFSARHPGIRTVRLRPALTFRRESSSQVRRLRAVYLVRGGWWQVGFVPRRIWA